jgi:phage shock protein PspC (stress-responsive transcriptional regulator)
MEQTETTTAGPAGDQRRPSPELVRPVEGRMIAGVARGLADRYGMPDWVPRLLFVLTTFAGGLGLILYVAGWVLIRSEDETEPIAARALSSERSGRSWLGIALIFIAALILLDNLTFLSGGVIWAGAFLVIGVLLYMGYVPTPWNQGNGAETGAAGAITAAGATTLDGAPTVVSDVPAGQAPPPPVKPTPTPPLLPPAASKPKERSVLGRLTIGVTFVGLGVLALLDRMPGLAIDADPRHYLALAVVIIGLGLLVGSVWGHAKWLILVGVFAVPTLLFSPAFELDWNEGEWDFTHVPVGFATVQESYSESFGDMVIDLTELPWGGETISMDVELDAGRVRIVVPEDVGLFGEASVNAGRVHVLGQESAGFGEPTVTYTEDGEAGSVELDVHVDLGEIEIVSR